MINIKVLSKGNLKIDKKTRKLIQNLLATIGVKGLAVIVSLLTLPAYLKFFNNSSVLGMWFTAISLLSWILTFDLGVGNGLRNNLVDPLTKSDFEKAKYYISSAYIIVSSVVFIAIIVGWILIPSISWNVVFNISNRLVPLDALIFVVRIVFLGIMLQFILRLIYSIFYAMQKAAFPSFLSLISNTMLLIFVKIVDSGNMIENLKVLALAQLILLNIPLIIATIIIFLTKLKNCVPSFKYYNRNFASSILKLGGKFFWLQIMTMIIFNTNEFLITWFVGPDKVVDYQIYNKIFGFISVLVRLLITPVWSAVTEASVVEDYTWIRRLYRKLMKVSLLALLTEVIIIFMMQWIVNVWMGKNTIVIHYSYSIIFAISTIVIVISSIVSNISNGLGELRIQTIFLTIGAIINIPLAFILTKITGTWVSIVAVNVISILPYCFIQIKYLNDYLNKKG